MPWSNQNGGGGPWGGGGDNNNNNNGPWGQGPKGPRGGGQNTPPDLEDILRKGQDRLKQVFPGGGGRKGSNRPIYFLIGAAVLGFWLFQSVYTVQPDELAVELRFGKPKEEVSEPGPHFHWWPFETYEKAQIVEKQINIGGQGTRNATQGLMLTGDQNIVNVQFSVLYRVSDPRAYLFNVDSPDAMVQQVSESAIREIVGRRPAQDVFRDNRSAIAQSVRDIVQQTLDNYKAGIQINAVSIEDAPPRVKWPMHLTKFSVPNRTRTASWKNRTSIPTRSWVRRAVKRRSFVKKPPLTRTVSFRTLKVKPSASVRC